MHLEIKSMARWCCCQEKTKELGYGILKSHQGGITSVNFNIILHPLKCAIFGISNLEISLYTLSFMSFRMYWIILLPELIPSRSLFHHFITSWNNGSTCVFPDFPCSSVSKETASNAGDLGRDLHSIPGSGRFLEKEMATHCSVFFPGESHGQRILAGYSPWGCKS